MAREILPHEPFVRAWLRGPRARAEDVDELVQECYCRFAMLETVDHIERPDIYFFSMARHLLARRRKRARIVPIDAVAAIDETIVDDAPSPEREVAARLAFERLKVLLEALPERCRRIVEMRKFDGLSQREIATTLGVTESIVENDVQLGLRLIRAAWMDAEQSSADRLSRPGLRGGCE